MPSSSFLPSVSFPLIFPFSLYFFSKSNYTKSNKNALKAKRLIQLLPPRTIFCISFVSLSKNDYLDQPVAFSRTTSKSWIRPRWLRSSTDNNYSNGPYIRLTRACRCLACAWHRTISTSDCFTRIRVFSRVPRLFSPLNKPARQSGCRKKSVPPETRLLPSDPMLIRNIEQEYDQEYRTATSTISSRLLD